MHGQNHIKLRLRISGDHALQKNIDINLAMSVVLGVPATSFSETICFAIKYKSL
jgi:hypothetical protein